MRAALLAAALAIAPAAACDLDYRLEISAGTAPPRIAARLRFVAPEAAETRLRLSPEWGGVTDFHRTVGDVTAEPTGEAGAWKAKHDPRAKVEVRYELQNGRPGIDAGKRLEGRDFYRNGIGRDFFQLFGHGTFLVPEHVGEGESVRVCVAVSGLRPGWSFATNHVSGHRDGARSWRFSATPAQLRAAMLVGGDFRVVRRDIAGRPLDIAIRGEWGFTDAAFADATARVVEAQRRFWDDLDFPRFLIALVPNHLARGSSGGTGLDQAFAMHASRDLSVPGPVFDFLIAHEHLHTWIPHRLGTMGADEARHYWFSEGFTNYLSHRLLLRSGVWKLEDYARTLNGMLEAYFNSPVREAPNAHILAHFWKDGAAQALPYQRGELFALHLARTLAASGQSLDAALRGLRLPASQLQREGGSRPGELAVNRLFAALRPHLGSSLDADLDNHIEAGRTVPIGPDFLGPCFEGAWGDKPRFELGFEREATFASRRVTGVVPGSAAERAGLRDDMQVERLSVHFGDLARDALVQVRGDGGVLRDIVYRPIAATPLRVPQFRVKDGAAGDPACPAWVGSASISGKRS